MITADIARDRSQEKSFNRIEKILAEMEKDYENVIDYLDRLVKETIDNAIDRDELYDTIVEYRLNSTDGSGVIKERILVEDDKEIEVPLEYVQIYLMAMGYEVVVNPRSRVISFSWERDIDEKVEK